MAVIEIVTEIGTEKDVDPAPRTDVGVQDQWNVVKGLNPGTGTEAGKEVVVEKDPLRTNLVLKRSRDFATAKKTGTEANTTTKRTGKEVVAKKDPPRNNLVLKRPRKTTFTRGMVS